MAQEAKGCSNYYFCYRWLLVLFKREFTSYEEVPLPLIPSSIPPDNPSWVNCASWGWYQTAAVEGLAMAFQKKNTHILQERGA